VSVSDSSVDRALHILHRAFDLALRSSLSLAPFVAAQVAYSLLVFAFGLVDDLAPCWLPFGTGYAALTTSPKPP